ncbi:hypothetical protein GGH12_001747 [Coemansia sp. RSA 1822]|nr:hypothetical protein LPJ76_001212 [Coemansia sp. RSA 638]KAJ2125364.1 hypothetical protein IW147_001010 [Coemansia sp. RSA 720]KAJ2545719.1 hypothetical protein GGF49_000228 [Coemansia sp. RSA 1853]KAJ2564934.1 hypothetical protein GGH12_001747 [Coemansia sp. RSA 1822]KAJ2662980.1 hypothetical protein IW148_002702 [Coemansia sp. RSA 1199]
MSEPKPSDSVPHPVFTREQRKTCHAKRDALFECLDENNIADPEKAGETCKDLRKIMYEKCPLVWANYFEKLRAMQKRKEQLYVDRPQD